ncbi:MAG TPA: thermopsin family protease, partial [Thermoplasmata archaeon]|nr:thermopsin family protease [Thermoplasmata archaeon]
MRFGISGRGWAALVLAALVIPSAVPLGVPLFAPAPSGSAPSAAGAPTGPSASPALDPGRGPAMASPLDRPVAPPSRGFAPVGLAVNPKALYSAEPAPMGIGDFGVTSSGSGYTYSTSRFLGTARIGTMAANASGGGGGWISLQLNVVLELTHGSSKAVYWIQDVPFFDTSSRTIYFEDNVWNLSGPSAYMRSSSISGSGYVYSGGYYAAGASYGAGNGATLANPAVVEAEVVASTISGTTYVGFEYNDGYGWVTYDNVTFPWTQGWNSDGFVVNGTSYNPFGIFYDAEWVYGGPGGGSTDIDLSSDLNLTLDYSNGHNFQAVVNAYDFGSNTAETVGNVVESYPSAASSGIPRAHVQNGSGSLGLLYGRSNVAIVNATTVVPEG